MCVIRVLQLRWCETTKSNIVVYSIGVIIGTTVSIIIAISLQIITATSCRTRPARSTSTAVSREWIPTSASPTPGRRTPTITYRSRKVRKAIF